MKTWLQLFRAPNLFTVPGDPLAGFLLASGAAVKFRPELLYVIVASMALYGFGLLLNDLMDFGMDRVERPSRPLPSGRANRGVVWVVAVLLVALGLGLCAMASPMTLYFGATLVVAIVAYNCGLKKIPGIGAVVMGICRGLNLMLGATLVAPFSVFAIAAALVVTSYITAVTSLARVETSNPAIPPLIGKLIRALILIQAVFCAISRTGAAGWVAACVLALALWPLSRIVGRKFYGS
ncbi:MAG: UbiA family prenyltransferase [Chthoniobacteraceae bacterium]